LDCNSWASDYHQGSRFGKNCSIVLKKDTNGIGIRTIKSTRPAWAPKSLQTSQASRTSWSIAVSQGITVMRIIVDMADISNIAEFLHIIIMKDILDHVVITVFFG
jgi:hypothetical protein